MANARYDMSSSLTDRLPLHVRDRDHDHDTPSSSSKPRRSSQPQRLLQKYTTFAATLNARDRRRAVFAVLALLLVLKFVVLDFGRRVVHELFFVRYVDGKRCEHIYGGHVEGAFYNPNDCFSRADIQQILLGLVWALHDVFERHNLPYWLDSGTLLGAYREKSVIPHDFDADVGIDEATYHKLRDSELHLDFPSVYELQVFEAKHLPHGNRDAGIPSRLVHTKSGMYIDIFVFLESRTPAADPVTSPMFGPIASSCFGGCKRCPKIAPGAWEFKIPKTWVYPLQPCWFGGRVVNCPAQPEKYLEYLYGPTYMTPKEE